MKRPLLSTLTLVFAMFAVSASAQWKPTKPVRFMLPFAPGGAAEAILRTVTDPLRERLGQPIVIEPRPGGGQMIAADAVVKSAPDGHTVLWASSTLITSPLLTKGGIDVMKDLVPVVHIGETVIMLVAHPDIPASSIAEFVRFARANPTKASYGFAGNASSMHLAGELMKSQGGFSMVSVPYKGSALLLPDLLSGRVPLAIDAITTLKPHVDAGKLRILAVMNGLRSRLLPDVPTMAESGFPGFNISPWNGFFLPAGTPRDIVVTLNRETNAVLQLPAVIDTLARTAGGVTSGGTPEQFAQRLRADIEQYAKIIQSSGIRGE